MSPRSSASPESSTMTLLSVSSSTASKGKGKAVDGGILSSAQSPTSAVLIDEKDEEIARLRAELKSRDEVRRPTFDV
jgi:hypothetical protein